MLGVSHGAIQFMTYEELKNFYNQQRKMPIDTKLVNSMMMMMMMILEIIQIMEFF